MNATIPAWLRLTIITLVAGLLLGCTYILTKDKIALESQNAAKASRQSVFTEADSFNELDLPGDSPLTNCFQAMQNGQMLGYVSTITVNGYGGNVEVTVGMKMNGEITGVFVGGSSFSETPGLGAKTKEESFRNQFTGMTLPVKLAKDGGTVDAVSAATISSRAITNGVNSAVEYMLDLK